jgi:signal transduction histidine kinase
MWFAGPVAVLFAAAAGVGVSWWITRPIRDVAATARKIVQTGDMSARVSTSTRRDELGDLVEQFNTLLQRNDNLLRAMREALDNVAHDLRTPLTRLRSGAEAALEDRVDPETVREALADSIEETERIKSLLDTILDVSAAEAGLMVLKRERVSVAGLLENVADLYSIISEDKSIDLSVDIDPNLAVDADPMRMQQVFANLVDNAVKYTPEGGFVKVTAERAGENVRVEIRDSGIGVPEDEQEKIWRRLYRTDQSRSQRGLGLGLSVVKAVVEAHRGTVTVRNHPEGGSVFSVDLPAVV